MYITLLLLFVSCVGTTATGQKLNCRKKKSYLIVLYKDLSLKYYEIIRIMYPGAD